MLLHVNMVDWPVNGLALSRPEEMLKTEHLEQGPNHSEWAPLNSTGTGWPATQVPPNQV